MADPLLVACPHCAAFNRVPPARFAEAPECGKCHRPLFIGKPLALDAAGFARHVPTLALFAHGRELARQAGAMGAADIVRWARANLPR